METEPDILHLGTRPEALSAADVLKLKGVFPILRVMRTIPVRDEGDIAVAKSYEAVADFLLLDTWRPSDPEIGATGIPHDWKISRRIVQEANISCILAGGIGPENTFEAMRFVKPTGVDSKTRTDLADGIGKDLQKVKAMFEAVGRGFL